MTEPIPDNETAEPERISESTRPERVSQAGRAAFRAVLRAARVPPDWIQRFKATLSVPGLLSGTLFFAASLTPSLLPRGWLLQGVLSGFAMGTGYALGVAYVWIWKYMELPLPEPRTQRVVLWSAVAVCVVVAVTFLAHASEWQDSVRALMGLDPVDTARPVQVGLLAYIVFVLLLGFARLFHLTHRFILGRLGPGMPRRVAKVVSLTLAVMAFYAVLNGVVFSYALRSADAAFQEADVREEPDVPRPTDPLRTGSTASLIAWEDLGRRGRAWVGGTPLAGEMEAFLGGEALSPIRVYVGLNAADTPADRARLALAELDRVGAFERSVLVIVSPTGTGWIDPSGTTTLEYLHRGDVASVALQYSYLPSWLTLLTDDAYGVETAEFLFQTVYSRWRELPREGRPRLYLHGVSLGALNSERSADLYDVIGDPFDGALWVGPPFRNAAWSDITRQRGEGSPAWLPRFRDGSVVRFMNQWDVSHPPETPWGPLRIVYLQYASDPITFFEPGAFYGRPEWLDEPRGRDVSERLRWYPVVTAMQLLADVAVADAAPVGYGHVFAPAHYLDAWVAVTDPPGWDEERLRRLREFFSEPK